MAEDIKSTRINEILTELFKGKDAALEKYAKVRHVQYEMQLWRNYGLPLDQVDRSAKMYFAKRFLKDGKIFTASEKEIKDAFERLNHAVKDGCHGRCVRLIEELNEEFIKLGLEPVHKIDGFLDWLTFWYNTLEDYATGGSVKEPEFSFEIRHFYDRENRKEFWAETKELLKEGKIMRLYRIAQIVLIKRKFSRTMKGD